MFQKDCEECIIFMDVASEAISAQMEAITSLENAVLGAAAAEWIAEAEKRASQCRLDCKQALERIRIHQLAHEARSADWHHAAA